MRAAQSRWRDNSGRFTAMDLMMRASHSGVVGDPLTKTKLTAALTTSGSVRRQPPACASKNYALLGRSDPLELASADHAAFATLGAMLTAVDPLEITGAPSTLPGIGAPEKRPHSASCVASGASIADSSSSSTRARGRSVPPVTPISVVDQFPPPPSNAASSMEASPVGVRANADEGSRSLGGEPLSPAATAQRPQTRRRLASQQSARHRHAQQQQRRDYGPSTAEAQQFNYSWSPSAYFAPGGIPLSRSAPPVPVPASCAALAAAAVGGHYVAAAAAAASAGAAAERLAPSRPSTASAETLRSPETLADFGARYARMAAGDARGPARPSSRGRPPVIRPSTGGVRSNPRLAGTRRPVAAVRPPSVPLIAPVPRPILTDKSGRSLYGSSLASESDASLRHAPLKTRGENAQVALRSLISDMMLGLKDEHGASLASFTAASSGAVAHGESLGSMPDGAATAARGPVRAASAPRLA
jgi:hypothetical protein